MEIEYYQKMYDLEETHWWFVGKRKIIFSILDKFYKKRKDLKILDVGCGTGIMLTHLKKYGDVTGVDDSAIALSLCRKRGHRQLFEAPITQLPLEEGTFDIVTCFDTLSHQRVKDDLQALRELYRVLKRRVRSLPLIRRIISYGAGWMYLKGSEKDIQKRTLPGKCKRLDSGLRKRPTGTLFFFLLSLPFV